MWWNCIQTWDSYEQIDMGLTCLFKEKYFKIDS